MRKLIINIILILLFSYVTAFSDGKSAEFMSENDVNFLLRTFKGNSGYVWSVSFSPDGRYIASESEDATVKLWDLSPKKFVIMVNSIIPGSPAEKSGVVVNDIIYSFNDKLFYDRETTTLAEQFIGYLRSLPEGSYNLVVLRKGEKVNLQINLLSLSTSPRLGIIIEVLENDPKIYFDKAIYGVNEAKTRNDLKEAANLFEKAKALSPNWPEVYYDLGLIYENLDYYDKAVENFSEYLKYALREKLSDVEIITKAIDRNKRKYELLESVKAKMVNSKWVLIKKVPSGKIRSSFIEKFKLDKLGRIWMINPLSETKTKDALQIIVERNIRVNPWFPIEFDGKFFEIRSFYIWLMEDANQTKFYVCYQIYEGEIDFNSSFPLIIVREFSKNIFEESYDSFDDAQNKASQKLKNYKFDEIKDFKYELHYRLE